jgi:hypothetical protein
MSYMRRIPGPFHLLRAVSVCILVAGFSAEEEPPHNSLEWLPSPRSLQPAPAGVSAQLAWSSPVVAAGADVYLTVSNVSLGASAQAWAPFCWVGLFSPPNADFRVTTPVRFQMLVADSAWAAAGGGAGASARMRFRLS